MFNLDLPFIIFSHNYNLSTISKKIDTIGGDGYPGKGEHVGIQNRNITIIGSYQDAVKKRYIDRHCVHTDNDQDFFLMNMTRYEEIQKDKNGRHLDCLGVIHEDYVLNGPFE